MTKTHKVVGEILGVKQNTVKNMRDEFDPIHDNNRKGWYQRGLTGSRMDTVNKYSAYTENELYKVVEGILFPSIREQIIFDEIDKEEISNSDQNLIEGELIEKKIMLYKRNQKSTKLCKQRDEYICQGCSFYYEQSIVECHHVKPISMIKETVVSMENLITLCPTCHRLAHNLLRRDYDIFSQKKSLIATLREISDSLKGKKNELPQHE